jgi:hypothetical protein
LGAQLLVFFLGFLAVEGESREVFEAAAVEAEEEALDYFLEVGVREALGGVVQALEFAEEGDGVGFVFLGLGLGLVG